MTKQIIASLMLASLIAISGASAPSKAHAKTVKAKPAVSAKMDCCKGGGSCCNGGCCSDAKAMKAKAGSSSKKDCCNGGSCCKDGAGCC